MLVLALGSLAAALVTGRDLYFNLAYLFGALLVLSAVWTWLALRGLRLTRTTVGQRAQVGRPLEEHFSLQNKSWLPKLWVVVRDESDLPGHHAGRVVHSLGAHREYGWTVRTLCDRRGRFRLGPMVISSSDPLGLFEFRRRVPQTGSVVVYPATVPLLGFPQPRSYLSGGDALRRRTHYITTNAAGVRDYAPGDGFNRIHWPSTARQAKLIVKEFELDPMLDVWIFLDMQRSAHVRVPQSELELAQRPTRPLWALVKQLQLEPSTEEYAVTAAACVVEHFLHRRRSVGLVAYGQHREVIQADRGERQLGKILETLAALRAEGDMPFREMLAAEAKALSRGVTLVAISPSPRQEWAETAVHLDHAGLRVVSIVVDPASFGGPAGAAVLRERFWLAGVPAVLLRNGDSLTEVLSALPDQERPLIRRPPYPGSPAGSGASASG